MVIPSVITAGVFAGVATRLPMRLTMCFVLIIDLTVFKIVTLLGRFFVSAFFLVLSFVLVCECSVHLGELVARHLNLANGPDSREEIPVLQLACFTIFFVRGREALPELGHQSIELFSREPSILQTCKVITNVTELSTHDLGALLGRCDMILCRIHDTLEVPADRL